MGQLEAARLLAKEALGAAKKRRQINAFFKKQGFISLGKGAWLGSRNRDVVSGFLIDGSPLDTYIETFILPAFDKHEFITWALGNRVVHCSPDTDTQEECNLGLTGSGIDGVKDLWIDGVKDLWHWLERSSD
jgi:hypothetical protein